MGANVEIDIQSVQGLGNILSRPDPYIKVTIEGSTQQTGRRHGHTADFNETLRFQNVSPHSTAHFVVMDKDYVSHDDVLASGDMSVAQFSPKWTGAISLNPQGAIIISTRVEPAHGGPGGNWDQNQGGNWNNGPHGGGGGGNWNNGPHGGGGGGGNWNNGPHGGGGGNWNNGPHGGGGGGNWNNGGGHGGCGPHGGGGGCGDNWGHGGGGHGHGHRGGHGGCHGGHGGY